MLTFIFLKQQGGDFSSKKGWTYVTPAVYMFNTPATSETTTHKVSASPNKLLADCAALLYEFCPENANVLAKRGKIDIPASTAAGPARFSNNTPQTTKQGKRKIDCCTLRWNSEHLYFFMQKHTRASCQWNMHFRTDPGFGSGDSRTIPFFLLLQPDSCLKKHLERFLLKSPSFWKLLDPGGFAKTASARVFGREVSVSPSLASFLPQCFVWKQTLWKKAGLQIAVSNDLKVPFCLWFLAAAKAWLWKIYHLSFHESYSHVSPLFPHGLASLSFQLPNCFFERSQPLVSSSRLPPSSRLPRGKTSLDRTASNHTENLHRNGEQVHLSLGDNCICQSKFAGNFKINGTKWQRMKPRAKRIGTIGFCTAQEKELEYCREKHPPAAGAPNNQPAPWATMM